MTISVPRAGSILLALPLSIACTTSRTRCASDSSAPADRASTISVADAQPLDANSESGGDESEEAGVSGTRQSNQCELIARELRFVARWRHNPNRAFGGKPLYCDISSTADICGRTSVDEDGLTSVAVPQNGPGAFFHFILNDDDDTKKRLTCRTIGLIATARPEPGVEHCGTVKDGPLAGMRIIADSRCDRLRMTLFDKAYQAKDPDAEKLTDCDEPLPERLAGPELQCKPVNFGRD
ncbi:hypothetical protein [Polyangium mundeleinium]|uniref:Lipoprotein n=1 Tax=Polyangium mundeleinium TaxID=2995306 RepID=A0ABT5EMW4_9BACT|nr:hypothetical protein [Polyangium mundeleinium]MDC0743175.1 hypothetical protein [Polyangium mundeleinium]